MDGKVRYGDRSLVYDALADERRRRVVRLLADADGALTIEDLAEGLVRIGDGRSDGIEDEAAVTRLRTSLYHVHVPKLSEAGIVRFSPERRRVRLTESVSLDVLDALES
jgi:DNA-binding transcriptional ArsR family regulator